jgi:hypothetical protein
MDEYLDICQKAVKKYLTTEPAMFDADRLVLMLEATGLCRSFQNSFHQDEIGFHCAALCLLCLNPRCPINSEDLKDQLDKIGYYVRLSKSTNVHYAPSQGKTS